MDMRGGVDETIIDQMKERKKQKTKQKKIDKEWRIIYKGQDWWKDKNEMKWIEMWEMNSKRQIQNLYLVPNKSVVKKCFFFS